MRTVDRVQRAFVIAPVLVVRSRLAGLPERLKAHCERMFRATPDTFPPKRAMNGIEELCADTARIPQLLEASAQQRAATERSEVSDRRERGLTRRTSV
jgi:hypothetical protein